MMIMARRREGVTGAGSEALIDERDGSTVPGIWYGYTRRRMKG